MICNTEVNKKRYLRQYISCAAAVKDTEQILISLENELKEFLKQVDIKLMIEYIEKIKQVRTVLIQSRYKKWFVFFEIYRKVEKVDDETEKRVLRLKYFEGMSWEQVAEEMNYSVRQIHNIHKRALINLKI